MNSQVLIKGKITARKTNALA